MLRPRIIPVLLVRDGALVKTRAFGKHAYIGDPPNGVHIFNDLRADELVKAIGHMYGKDPKASPDLCRIINSRNFERLKKLLDDSVSAGAKVEVGGDTDAAERYIAPTVLSNVTAEHAIMSEEIFGPILPVIPYDVLDDALAEINAGERPLGLYVYSKDPQVVEHVLRQTSSGGACVNVCAVQGALPSLGFGGVGQSGSGRHHGIEGFREFSNPRGVVVRGTGDMIDAFLPPYGPAAQAIVDSVLGGAEAPEVTAPGVIDLP